jgi:hypothetical protein
MKKVSVSLTADKQSVKLELNDLRLADDLTPADVDLLIDTLSEMRAQMGEPPNPYSKKNPPGAQFEILVDGKPQSYGDVKDVAIASAELIKSHNPLSDVAVRDMETGEITPVSYKPGII